MAYRLACDHAGLIAGIVSLQEAMNEDSSACDPSEPVSVVEIHGTADTVIRYEGGRNDDADPNAPAYPSAAQSVLEWARFNGCDDTAARGEPPEPAPGLRRIGGASRSTVEVSAPEGVHPLDAAPQFDCFEEQRRAGSHRDAQAWCGQVASEALDRSSVRGYGRDARVQVLGRYGLCEGVAEETRQRRTQV